MKLLCPSRYSLALMIAPNCSSDQLYSNTRALLQIKQRRRLLKENRQDAPLSGLASAIHDEKQL